MEFIKTNKIKTSITYSRSGHYTVSIFCIYMYGTRQIKQVVFKSEKIDNISKARFVADQAVQEISANA